jgi:hypothetical protein
MILAKRRKARIRAHEQEFQEFKHDAGHRAQPERAWHRRAYPGERHGYTHRAQRYLYYAPYHVLYRAPYHVLYHAPYRGGYCAPHRVLYYAPCWGGCCASFAKLD